jgi:decaprenyl-phosphate phosphoribosyltransferase
MAHSLTAVQPGDGAAAPALRTASRFGRLGPAAALLATARPRQWLKNALVIAAPGAAGALGRDDVPQRVALACLAFCALASGIYAINDVRDVAEDRRHPVKRLRPVAAGQLSERSAVTFGVALMLGGVAVCLAIRPLLAAVALGYLALTLTYTMIWRHLLLIDVVAIAGGFVLRAVAGGVAAPVDLSEWFLLVVSFAAVLVAAGKRWAELRRTATVGGTRRRVLEHYTEARLRVLLWGSGAGALFTYGIWAFEMPDARGFPWRPLTILPFAVCLARYGNAVRAGEAEAPEELILRDRWLLAAGFVWLVLFALEVHATA